MQRSVAVNTGSMSGAAPHSLCNPAAITPRYPHLTSAFSKLHVSLTVQHGVSYLYTLVPKDSAGRTGLSVIFISTSTPTFTLQPSLFNPLSLSLSLHNPCKPPCVTTARSVWWNLTPIPSKSLTHTPVILSLSSNLLSNICWIDIILSGKECLKMYTVVYCYCELRSTVGDVCLTVDMTVRQTVINFNV